MFSIASSVACYVSLLASRYVFVANYSSGFDFDVLSCILFDSALSDAISFSIRLVFGGLSFSVARWRLSAVFCGYFF